MTLTDTHAHLYSPKFNSDRPDMVRRAIASGVTHMYLPNIDSGSVEPMLELEAAFPDHCHAMMGLHPCSVDENVETSLAWVERHLGERRWAGVGETGLDLYWDKTWFAQQQTAFARQIQWAIQLDLPVIIHSRESTPQCIDLVRAAQNGRLHGVFHCFSGTVEEARQIIDLGFMLGVGGTVTYPKSELPDVLKAIPLEHIVLETDAPYLPPVPYRGKRNESAYIVEVAQKLAEVYDLDPEELARITTANAARLFRTPVPHM